MQRQARQAGRSQLVRHPEPEFIADWQTMTERYKTQPAVVGMTCAMNCVHSFAGAPTTCAGNCSDPTDAVPTPECLCEFASWGDATRN